MHKVTKNKDGKFVINKAELEEGLRDVIADMRANPTKYVPMGTASSQTGKLANLSRREALFYQSGRDATKRMADKVVWDKLMAERWRALFGK